MLGEPNSSAAAAFHGVLCLACFHSVVRDVDKLSAAGEFSTAAAALKHDIVLVERNSVLDDDWEVGVQASGRVDVPGGVPQLAPASSQGPPLRFALIVPKAPFLGTDTVQVVSRVTVLVRSLSGKTSVVDGDLGELVSQFNSRLALLTGIPRCHFHLSHQGNDALICMHSGVRGGVKPPVVPGSWHCYTSNLEGCWPSRNTCFRCLAPRGASPSAGNRRQQRENQALGRAPQRSPAVEPMHRRASASDPPPEPAAPRVVPPRVPGADGTDTQSVLKTLRHGLSEDLLVQEAKRLQALATKKVSSRERQMAHLKEQLHHLRGRIDEQSDPVVAKLDGLNRRRQKKKASTVSSVPSCSR